MLEYMQYNYIIANMVQNGVDISMSYSGQADYSTRPRRNYKLLRRLAAVIFTLTSFPYASVHADERAKVDMRTAILCAYEPEWQALLPSLTDRQEARYGGVTFVTGQIESTPVVVIESGIGPINAAVATQTAIDHYKLNGIIVIGISGGIDPNLHVGDVVVPAQWREYLDSVFARERDGRYTLPSFFAAPQTENFGMIFPQPVRVQNQAGGSEPHTWFPVDARLLGAARKVSAGAALETCTVDRKCLHSTPHVIVGGNGISGSAFVDNVAFRDFAHRAFMAEAVDMEAAAVAHTAFMNTVPFLSIRSLSDLAGGDASSNEMEAFQGLASQNAVAVLRAILLQLRHGN